MGTPPLSATTPLSALLRHRSSIRAASLSRDGSIVASWNEGRSIHIGLNSVDDAVYEGWLPPLVSAENDAHAMRDLANATGYASRVLLGVDATRENVTECLAATIERLVPGDVLKISYAGHMTSLAGVGDDADGWDEAWCLYDGILLDDEFHDLLADVPAGVDVVVITDACFAGGITDEPSLIVVPRPLALPPDGPRSEGRISTTVSRDLAIQPSDAAESRTHLGRPTFGLSDSLKAEAGIGDHAFVRGPNARLGDREIGRLVRQGKIPRGQARPAAQRPAITARVISLAAAAEGSLAFEGDRHGLFTAALLQAVADSRVAPASYDGLMGAIAASLPMQRPTMGVFGAAVPADAATPAFSGQSVAAAPATDAAPSMFGVTKP